MYYPPLVIAMSANKRKFGPLDKLWTNSINPQSQNISNSTEKNDTVSEPPKDKKIRKSGVNPEWLKGHKWLQIVDKLSKDVITPTDENIALQGGHSNIINKCLHMGTRSINVGHNYHDNLTYKK
jgi:hypothetical protein